MELGLYHDSHKLYYRSTFGAAPTGSTVQLRLSASEDAAPLLSVQLRLWHSRKGERILPMVWDGDAFSIALTLPDQGCLLWYYFIIRQGGRTLYYGNNAGQLGGPGAMSDAVPPSYQLTVCDKDAHTPDWFKHAIVYQIFPDRFCRSRRSRASLEGKRDAVIHSRWEDEPFYCKDPKDGSIVYYDFFGGNLAGIREKLSYLKDLGVTVLYLNPIFQARSNHRYDTGDYKRVDPFLGSEDELRKLCKAAKALGIRIVLDGVFSHTGADSLYFNKFGFYKSTGAYQSKDSPYYDWYRFKDYPDTYECWWGVDDLPNVEETTPSYLDFIIRDEDSVLKHWLKAGISGWRLDVIDELPESFLRCFYKTLKQQDPEALLIGEVWEDASNKVSYSQQREYLCGYDIDSAMNYALRTILLDFLQGHGDAAQLEAALLHLIENYPKENWYAMLNLIGSHDVERILTVLTDIGGTAGRTAGETGKDRLKLLLAWQFTMPGAPCIYYGDEAGLTGRKDPDNRRTYPWGHEDKDLQCLTKKLGQLRHRYDALQTGRFIPLYASGDGFAYARTIEGSQDVFGKKARDGFFLVALNRNAAEARTLTITTDGLAYGLLQDVLDPDSAPVEVLNGRLTLTLPPLGCRILQGRETAQKRAGLLLHPTSLPSPYGHGELGREAYTFVDFLKKAGQSVWQILPLTPPLLGDSPYLSLSAFAGSEQLISLEVLHDWGWLSDDLFAEWLEEAGNARDWADAWDLKQRTLWQFTHDNTLQVPWAPYEAFCKANAYWLEDYALFRALTAFFLHAPWTKWPEDIRHHATEALHRYRKELAGSVDHYKFLQYIFYRQWDAIHTYARQNGISILGDMPMFVAHNSADCWAHQDLYQLDEYGSPENVAGVPPDYFSKDGQLWGNPLYDYAAMEKEGYRWWIERFRTLRQYVDEIRIDHFRGFAAYWSVPRGAETAKEGHWMKGPGKDLFQAVEKALGPIPFVAEDLGIITDDVCALRQDLQLPGMKVLQFHLKERADGQYSLDTEPDSVIYTGTHDNNTLVGWFADELAPWQRQQLCRVLGIPADASSGQLAAGAIAYLYSRRARTAIVPVQDILALPGSARMNVPGVAEGNWHWQLESGALTDDLAEKLAALVKEYRR